jgi:hypothetical protein
VWVQRDPSLCKSVYQSTSTLSHTYGENTLEAQHIIIIAQTHCSTFTCLSGHRVFCMNGIVECLDRNRWFSRSIDRSGSQRAQGVCLESRACIEKDSRAQSLKGGVPNRERVVREMSVHCVVSSMPALAQHPHSVLTFLHKVG